MWEHINGNALKQPYEYIVRYEATQGTETSKYLQEEKERSIFQVAASERERGQTVSLLTGLRISDTVKDHFSGRRLESRDREGKIPVREKMIKPRRHQSRTGHVESGLKPGGPPPKPKYYPVTDSEQYREGKVKRTPGGE